MKKYMSLIYQTTSTLSSGVARLGHKVYYMGASGSGAKTKLSVNALLGLGVQAIAEALHLDYRRNDADTCASTDVLINDALVGMAGNSNLQSELNGYTGDDRLDEAHSYIGTEYAPIPPDLENHYKEYVENRAAIVAAYAAERRK
jgi:hypothetical protein